MNESNTYTVFARFPAYGESIEEVDVQASSEVDARDRAAEILSADYLPGWEIIRVEERLSAPGWTALY